MQNKNKEINEQIKHNKRGERKMIDFHTHIIPNIDDGARNIEETCKLIQEAKAEGFKGIILTPHYRENYFETNIPEINVWLKVIEDNLKEKGIDIDLYLGNEIYFTENIMELLINGKASTINNTCYVLFEMPLDIEPENLYNVIYSLKENKLIPILAHPERYKFVQKEPELINDLIDNGVLMQANYGSILGQYGEKAEIIVRKFLENRMIHFLGSDVHRKGTTYKAIQHAIEEIKEIIGEEELEKLTTTNPMLVLQNKKIEIEEPEEAILTFKEKLIMYLKR